MISESFKKIALVDDDRIFHHLTKKKLTPIEGIRIFSFYDGSDILVHIQENLDHPELLPDVIFLDINMPLIDGWMLMKELEQIPAVLDHIDIHILTSSINHNDYLKAQEHPNVQSYITKPLTPEKMHELLALS